MPRVKLAKAAGISEKEVSVALEALRQRYADPSSGLAVIEKGKDVEIATKAENAETVGALLASDREDALGKATLEVLAIVAYRGPITRAEIDAIRGVNCSFALRNLLLRGLVDRQPNPLDAREYEYTPSFRLLETLGVSSLADLPEYESLSHDSRLETLERPEGQNPPETEESDTMEPKEE